MLPLYGAMLYQLSYQASWELVIKICNILIEVKRWKLTRIYEIHISISYILLRFLPVVLIAQSVEHCTDTIVMVAMVSIPFQQASIVFLSYILVAAAYVA